MKHIKTVKSTPSQSITIYKRESVDDYSVVISSRKGYQRKDFDTLQEAEKYARKRAGIMR